MPREVPGPPPPPNEREKRSEGEPAFYHRAAHFLEGEKAAGKAYFQLQELIFEELPSTSLSVYRFAVVNEELHPEPWWIVAILGDRPAQRIDDQIEAILAPGETVDLPPQVLIPLILRRAQQGQEGQWVKRHYRPKKKP